MILAVEKLITTDINKPARYLGNEFGAVHKNWQDSKVRWVLTYPEIYEVGASNLGHIILYNIINTQPRQLCDRSYLPALDLATKLRDTHIPLFAVESKRSLKDFDILGFSLSYELGGTNILEMLYLAQIPLTWKERNEENNNYPLIFAGGQTATSNPEPYTEFLDFIVLGDGEELLPEIGLVLEEGKDLGLNRQELLLDLAQVPGVYVPQFYDMNPDGSVVPNRLDVPKRILRRVATPIPAYSVGLVPFIETVHDRLSIEIRRGCTRGCRFCQPGMLTRPARDVEPEKVVEAVENAIRKTGYNEFSLLSLSCSDYLALPSVGMEIKNRLKDENVTLSLPSQRVDRFDENIANIIGGTRQGSLTFAPEAGTQRMRDIINKGLTNEELLRGIKTAVEQGWDKVKLYFMIGLPGETDADVLGITETVRWLQQQCRIKGRKPLGFNITISNFTPKPHTPFQWHSVSTEEFKRKQDLLRAEFRHIKGVKANFTDVRISAMEDFVGRGDRSLSQVLYKAWQNGAGMDAWFESLDQAFSAWENAINEVGLSWKYRQVESGEWNIMEGSDQDSLNKPLPWDHLDTGIDKKWLQDDLKRALEAATIGDCSFEGCSHCGVCSPDFGHNIVISPPEIPQFAGNFTPDVTKVQRIRVWFGKLGNMALISHLDLMRLLERAIRRASLPITFTGGFHPHPRISIANALSLGNTSIGEIAEFDLKERVDLEFFRKELTAQLPEDMPIYDIAEVDLKESAINQLSEAEYLINVAVENNPTWENWVKNILDSEEINVEQTTKSGKKQIINLRDRLSSLEVVENRGNEAILKYVGSCKGDGTLLRSHQVVLMLEQIAKTEINLLHTHRNKLILA
jgi:radical SAM family uncharacterized protein/radical SAM-linked protein